MLHETCACALECARDLPTLVRNGQLPDGVPTGKSLRKCLDKLGDAFRAIPSFQPVPHATLPPYPV